MSYSKLRILSIAVGALAAGSLVVAQSNDAAQGSGTNGTSDTNRVGSNDNAGRNVRNAGSTVPGTSPASSGTLSGATATNTGNAGSGTTSSPDVTGDTGARAGAGSATRNGNWAQNNNGTTGSNGYQSNTDGMHRDAGNNGNNGYGTASSDRAARADRN